MTKTKAKIGDMVCVEWADAVSFGRIEAECSELPLPIFETYGKLGFINEEKVVVIHEQESPRTSMPEGISRKTSIEPTALPLGMVRRIVVYPKSRR